MPTSLRSVWDCRRERKIVVATSVALKRPRSLLRLARARRWRSPCLQIHDCLAGGGSMAAAILNAQYPNTIHCPSFYVSRFAFHVLPRLGFLSLIAVFTLYLRARAGFAVEHVMFMLTEFPKVPGEPGLFYSRRIRRRCLSSADDAAVSGLSVVCGLPCRVRGRH